MNKRNFVFNYVPLKRDFDELQNNMESGIKDVTKAVTGMGILSGLTVSISSSEATVSPGVAFDGQGNRIALDNALTVDMGSITRPSAGKYKWVTLALRYVVANEGQVIDGNNVSWPARLLDSYSALLLEGSEGTATTALKPPFLDWQVPLLDIRVDRSSHWENLVTETKRRQSIRNGFDADLLDGKHLSEILSAIHPVGCIYAQYPGGKTPTAMGWPGTWETQFEREGVFFRTSGPKAHPFDYSIQEDAFQGHGHQAYNSSQRGSNSAVFAQGETALSPDEGKGARVMEATTDGVHGIPRAGYETRPINRTFRIWKRTA